MLMIYIMLILDVRVFYLHDTTNIRRASSYLDILYTDHTISIGCTSRFLDVFNAGHITSISCASFFWMYLMLILQPALVVQAVFLI